MKTLKAFFMGAFMLTAGCISTMAAPDIKYFQPRELIQVSNDVVDMAFDQAEASVDFTAKSAFELYCRCPWLTATQVGNKIVVKAEPNNGFVPRTARVILTTKKENVSRVINFVQKPEPGHDKYYPLPTEGNILPLTSLDLSKATHDNYIDGVRKNKPIEGGTVRIKNNTYETSVSTHARSVFRIQLNGAMRFVTDLGIDDAILTRTPENHGDAKYQFLLDGKEVAAGRITILDKAAAHVDINTHGGKVLEIILDPNGSNWGDHIDLGNPYFELTAAKPELID